MMKKLIYAFLLFCISGKLFAQKINIDQPVKKHTSAFAVIIDSTTYAHVKPAVMAYKQMLEEKEGLSVYVVSANWSGPDQVQQVIKKLAKEKITLEGTVLIGDIPVTLIRNGQHLTTAFKMDEEKFPFDQSSIASDRFYDDFDLSFKFLKKDSKNPLWYYYELKTDCPQYIASDIYSARILSHKTGEAKYLEISTFLQKAVKARENTKVLTHFTSFTGSAYNSESLTAWNDENIALKEVFKQSFKSPHTARLLNFRMDNAMKFQLFTELQRPGLDLMLFTEHGDVSKQYINSLPSGNDFDFAYNYVMGTLRTAVRKAKQKGQDELKVKLNYITRYQIPEAWFINMEDNDSLKRADSLYAANVDIVTKDLEQLKPQAKVVIFNACYNGSFHKPNNIVGGYIFGQGATLVCQGNTVNVLQDRWTIDLLGLLAEGVRTGFFARFTNSLESHLIGDPTYHFKTGSFPSLNAEIGAGSGTKIRWTALLNSNEPAVQALALKQLFMINPRSVSGILIDTYKKSSSYNVRMECLNLASALGDENYRKMLALGLDDNYELIRRKAASWIANDGSDRFIPGLVALLISRPNDERVFYAVHKALSVMDLDKVEVEVKKQMEIAGFLFKGEEQLNQWLVKIKKDRRIAEANLNEALNKKASITERVQAIRSMRNYNYHAYVPQLLDVIKDKEAPVLVRQNIIEAIGWFSTSYQKNTVLTTLGQILNDKDEADVLVNESQQSINRLNNWKLY